MISGIKRTCEMCGQIPAAHDRDVRFGLPEPVLSSPEQHRAEGSWLSDPDPTKATLMQIPNISPFVRALLPIKLQGGHECTDLKLTGYLANKIQPWGRYKVPVNSAVLNPDYTPYCVGSPNGELNDVLNKEWPHDILTSLPA